MNQEIYVVTSATNNTKVLGGYRVIIGRRILVVSGRIFVDTIPVLGTPVCSLQRMAWLQKVFP